MKDKKTLKNEKAQGAEKKNGAMEELDEKALDEVGGGTGNPFANVARVPTQKIDPKVRKDG
ncbi:MAG: hypothetical protein IJS65_05710 [Clostridia bacterium]|nr:hypothetical protein [Clostridia bacterium]